MKTEASSKVVDLLREAADIMEADREDEYVLFPGIDPDYDTPDGIASRGAARGLLREGISPDDGVSIPVHDLGCLVRYIADLTEE